MGVSITKIKNDDTKNKPTSFAKQKEFSRQIFKLMTKLKLKGEITVKSK